jgi:hypothetical protein
MSDITTCPKCKADLSVSTAPGESFVCSRCGYTATKPMTLPPDDRDTDVRRTGWRPAHNIILIMLAAGVGTLIILFAACNGFIYWGIKH